VLDESDIEKLVNFVVTNVELFKLLERLNTLYVFELTSSNMEESYVFERCSNVTKTWNN
jgi:hypothetical protein